MREIHSKGRVTFNVLGVTVDMPTKGWLEYLAWRTQATRTINKILQND